MGGGEGRKPAAEGFNETLRRGTAANSTGNMKVKRNGWRLVQIVLGLGSRISIGIGEGIRNIFGLDKG